VRISVLTVLVRERTKRVLLHREIFCRGSESGFVSWSAVVEAFCGEDAVS
jgi:hypothetical protein